MFMLPPFALRQIAELTPFLPPLFPSPNISSFWGTSIAITPSETQKVIPTPRGEEAFNWVISNLLLLNNPNISTLLHRSSGSPSSPNISFVTSCWEVLPKLGLDHLPILLTIPVLWSSAPTNVPLSSIFRKLVGMTALNSTLTVRLQKNTRLCLFPLLLLSLLL